MWDLNRAERKALGAALVLVGVSLISRTLLAPEPGRVHGLERIDPATDLEGIESEVVAALTREQRAQTPLADGEQIDVNRAPADELRRLPGVGPSLAEALIEERERAPFSGTADLERVPGVGEVTARRLAPYLRFERGAPRAAPAPAASVSTGCPPGGARIDLNRASPAQLESLSGIGPALAARIIEDRSENGPFEAPEAVTRVSGIGPRTLARFREQVCTGTR
ncbi:ComEA family DNA-binding protein [Candidatus Palauibacter sp.]|uniref:ComEA family DNA-binding protein n=1 Tax=Candidatus Palauibacter sp. TaxID=3101350 RepID=UPI003B02EC92